MIHQWHSNGANMSINGLFPGFQNILCCLFSANRRVRSRLNWLEDDVFILILSKHHLHHPQELLLITIRGYLNELNRWWVTGCWCPIKAISGSIVLAGPTLSSVAGANCVIEPAVASVTPLSWSHPHCHAVTPCHESRDMSGRITLFVCDGLPIREPPDILTSGAQRMTVSGTSRGSPDSRPSSIYGDINKSHSSRYESKFHCKSHIWEPLKLINVGNLFNLKAFCVWTEHWTALCLFRQWAKLAAIYFK